MSTQQLFFNGIDGATGEYLVAPTSSKQLARVARGLPPEPQVRDLRWWVRNFLKKPPFRALKAGLDPKKLEEAGWGVIFAADADPEVREALSPLLEHRRAQAGDFYREYVGADGARAGESKLDFLSRHQVGPGPADPRKMPYYLLVVGDPESIPFCFQYQLDVQYAVGRLAFDTAQEYEQYAKSVVETETGDEKSPRRLTFFAVRTPGDRATELSADHLVSPLVTRLAENGASDWEIETILADEATKMRLGQVLTSDAPPALLFTASHGMGYRLSDPRQRDFQGSIVCQDWAGPGSPLDRDHYFAAEDVGSQARLQGLLAFHFACYGAGTPALDDYAHALGRQPEVAPHAFVARLPQRLLGHPKGGALAVVGHIERAWGFSFLWTGAGRQLAAFESVLDALVDGHPLGSAMEAFNQRYAELSCDLSAELEGLGFGRKADEEKISDLWTARNDARNYVVLGDPAVRMKGAWS